jgi:fluoroquinolone transport system permease protein
MSRRWALFINDIRFQIRHGIYYAYVLITAMYVLLLTFIPDAFKARAITLIVFSDPSVLGFFFVGGIILLERGQNVLDNLFVSPLYLREYLLSKAGSLAVLSVLTSMVIHISVLGVSSINVSFVLGVGLTSLFFTLLGIGVAVRCRSLNAFFLLAPLYTLVFLLPLLSYFNVYETLLISLLPTHSSLLLIEASFNKLPLFTAVGHILWLICWIFLAYFWAYRSFDRFVLQKIGG